MSNVFGLTKIIFSFPGGFLKDLEGDKLHVVVLFFLYVLQVKRPHQTILLSSSTNLFVSLSMISNQQTNLDVIKLSANCRTP